MNTSYIGLLLLLIFMWILAFLISRNYSRNSYIKKNQERYKRESKECPSCGGRDFIFRRETDHISEINVTGRNSYSKATDKLICVKCHRILLLPPNAIGEYQYGPLQDEKSESASESWYDPEHGTSKDVEKEIIHTKPSPAEIVAYAQEKLEFDSKMVAEKKAVAVFLLFQTMIIIGIILTLRKLMG